MSQEKIKPKEKREGDECLRTFKLLYKQVLNPLTYKNSRLGL